MQPLEYPLASRKAFEQTHGQLEESPDDFTLRDVAFILLRHWQEILILSLGGLVAAGVLYFVPKPVYATNAKLLVRYVLERNAVDTEVGSSVQKTTGGRDDSSVLKDEMEILRSWDLAKAVAAEMGPDRLIPAKPGEEGASVVKAAKAIVGNLEVVNAAGSNIVSVTYKSKDPELAVELLENLIKHYFDRHLEIHRWSGATKLIAGQIEQVRSRLAQIEQDLNRARGEAGVTLGDNGNPVGTANQRTNVRDDLLAAEAERAAQLARIMTLEGVAAGAGHAAGVVHGAERSELQNKPGDQDVLRYQMLLDSLGRLRERDLHLRGKFSPENSLVRENQREIDSLEMQRRSLAAEFPALLAVTSANSKEQPLDLDAERAKLAGAEARVAVLNEQAENVRKTEENLPERISRIRQLERLQRTEQEKYDYLATAAEKARIDEMLDSSKMPNISFIQNPSPPEKVVDTRLKKLLFALILAGVGSGIGVAFFIELVLDRRVKSPQEIERKLRIPLLASMPCARPKGDGDQVAEMQGAVRDLFDRLSTLLNRSAPAKRPRLIGMTGAGRGVGASTLALHLKKVCQENGEKALFVDIQAGSEEPDSIFAALESAGGKVPDGTDRGKAIPARQLLGFLPIFRAIDCDFVLFDLPPIGSGSPTWALSSGMDRVLIIASPDRTERAELRRCYDELILAGAEVSCIFNQKTDPPPCFWRELILQGRTRFFSARRDLVERPELAASL